MTALRTAWAGLAPRLSLLEPCAFAPDAWQVLERLHACFNDRAAHARLPLPIARFREAAAAEIFACACRLEEVATVDADDGWLPGGPHQAAHAAMAAHARAFAAEVDAMLGVLVPGARYRKGHYAYGRFTVAAPHGLHTDHSAEDPGCTGEPICIARIRTLGTHCLSGDYGQHDAALTAMLHALRSWTPGPAGTPEAILETLLRQGILGTIPVDHVVLMVAGNASARTQVTQHIAARPPEGGVHSAFFQRQYRLG